jgi:hypothetical protein
MNSSAVIPDEPFLVRASSVVVTDSQLTVYWLDGRTLSVPLFWYPRLVHGSSFQRNKVEFDDFGIHWPELDEALSYKGLLLGWKSGESDKSFNRWLEFHLRGEKVPIPELPLPKEFAQAGLARRRKPNFKKSHKKLAKIGGLNRV